MALLLATGETFVDRALDERGVDLELAEGFLDFLDPVAQLGSLASHGRSGGAQEVGHGNAGNLDGVLHGQEEPGTCTLVDAHREDVFTVEGDGAGRDLVLGVTGDGVRQSRLAGAVGAHDRVGLAGADRQVDTLEDLDGLGVRIGVGDLDVQVTNLEDRGGVVVTGRHEIPSR